MALPAYRKKADRTQQVKGTDTCHWIHNQQNPAKKKTMYAQICCDARPEKSEPKRPRITAGGDQLKYEGDVRIKTTRL